MMTFLQRTFTSLVHTHAGRTQTKAAGLFLTVLKIAPAWGVRFLEFYLSNFKEFVFQWTYGHADSIRALVFSGNNGLIDVDHFFSQEGNSFLKKALKPDKETLLHDFIKETLHIEIEYYLRKVFEETIEDIYEILDKYNAQYSRYDQYKGDDYNHYIITTLKSHVFDQLSNEVFTLLYQDREFLRAFNEAAARYVRKLKYKSRGNSNYLQNDGVFIRCEYWPKWLKDGLFFRDKGRCTICQSDLTGLYATGKKLAIDHIVPLANGGVNDPTNLQILCQSCNSKKGARSSNTKHWVTLYWRI